MISIITCFKINSYIVKRGVCMKAKNIIILSLFIFSLFVNTNSYSADIYTDKVSNGVIGVSHKSDGKKLKVMIEKGSEKYTYGLRNDGEKDYYPLQLGSGTYKLSILENVSGTKYSLLKSENIEADIKNKNDVYLNSIRIINWSQDDPAIKKAKSINNSDKIYDYIIKNVKYDYKKADTVQPGYYPVINETFKTNMGICYDYSSMDAAMLRSIGVPTKLVKGYVKGVDGYHAWNEAFINGKWVVIDTTYDAAKWGSKEKYTMKKNSSDYQKVYEY